MNKSFLPPTPPILQKTFSLPAICRAYPERGNKGDVREIYFFNILLSGNIISWKSLRPGCGRRQRHKIATPVFSPSSPHKNPDRTSATASGPAGTFAMRGRLWYA
nr:hypothetical protein DWUX_241 [Desulfovibrio diazotrophicus]